jgi:drug/metabolite transporter (DMT)-like permease
MNTHTLRTHAPAGVDPTHSRPGIEGWLTSPWAGLVAATLFWSGNFVIGRSLRGQIEPLALNFIRWMTAAIVLAPFVWGAFRTQWPLIHRHWAYVSLLGITGLAVPHTCSYYAVQTTTAVNALLLLIMMPVVVALGSWRFFGQRIRALQWAGIAVCMVGAAGILVRWDLNALLHMKFTRGDLWVLPAVAMSSAHTLLLKKTPAGITQGPLLLASMFSAIVLMLPGVMWIGAGELAAVNKAWPQALYVGVFASAAAFLLWNRGVVAVGAQRASPMMYLMPVYASVLSAIFLGEGVQAYQVAGGAVVLTGLWLARGR